jgi:TonB family protein
LFEFTIPSQSRRPLAASIVVHGLILLLMFAIRFSGSIAKVPVAERHLVYLAPATRRQAPLLRTPLFRVPHPAQAHLELPSIAIIPSPVIEMAKPILPDIPRVEAPAVVVTAVIKASGFSDAHPALPPVPAKAVVKVSGFESTETSATGPGRGALPTNTGSFDSARSEGTPARKINTVSRAGGFSDASASFAGGARGGAISNGSFGDTTVDKGAAVRRRTTAATFTPVEILSKPKPAYTQEARAKKIEGEVLLSMQFSASGEARVEGVMRGLGYGLDETAVTAARGIRFRPATRDGGAVDSAAVVHILFQLAQ